MLNQQDLNTLATVFGKTVEEISGAISNEEETSLDLRLPGKVYTQQEIDSMKESLKTTHTDAGIEIGTKKLAKALGVELEAGEKDPDKLAAKLTASMEQKFKSQTPTEEMAKAIAKAQEWENKYNKLFETHESVQNSVKDWETKYKEKEREITQSERNRKILSAFPDKIGIDKNDALLIFNSTFSHDVDESGNTIIKRGNEIVQDPVGKPETLDNIIASFVEEKNWVRKKNGMQGGDDGVGGGTRLPKGLSKEDAAKYLEEKGIDAMSIEGGKMFMQMTKSE